MLGKHAKAVLQFSGGKDSLAALYMCRPWLDRIEVHFGDTGAVFPHIVEFVKRTCEGLGANLRVIRPEMKIETYHEKVGLPSDIVPDWASAHMAVHMAEPPKVLVQSALNCCFNMLWKPLAGAVLDSGATLVIRGIKGDDERLGIRAKSFHDANGIEYAAPVWDFTDGDVLAYLKREGATIPPQYPKVDDGLDCWLCTGHLRTHYAESRARYIKEHYPQYRPELRRRAEALRKVLYSEMDEVGKILEIVIDG